MRPAWSIGLRALIAPVLKGSEIEVAQRSYRPKYLGRVLGSLLQCNFFVIITEHSTYN